MVFPYTGEHVDRLDQRAGDNRNSVERDWNLEEKLAQAVNAKRETVPAMLNSLNNDFARRLERLDKLTRDMERLADRWLGPVPESASVQQEAKVEGLILGDVERYGRLNTDFEFALDRLEGLVARLGGM